MKHSSETNKMDWYNLEIIDTIFQWLNSQSIKDIKEICKKFIENTREASERDFILIWRIIDRKDAYINWLSSSDKDFIKKVEEFFSTLETLRSIYSIQTQNSVNRILWQDSLVKQEKQELFTQKEFDLFVNIFYRSFLEKWEKDKYILPNSEMLFVYLLLKKVLLGVNISEQERNTFAFLISRTLPWREWFKLFISNISSFSNLSSNEEKKIKSFFSDFINNNELVNWEKPKNHLDATKLENFFTDSDLLKKYKIKNNKIDTSTLVKDEKFLFIFMNFFEKNVLKITNKDPFVSGIVSIIWTIAEWQELEAKILISFSNTIDKFIENRLWNSNVMTETIRNKNLDIYEFTKFDNSKLVEKVELRDQVIKENISNDFIIQVLISFKNLLLEKSKTKTSD